MSSFKKCGISVAAADGSEDFEINLEGVVNFMVDKNDTLSDTEYHFHVRVAYCYMNTHPFASLGDCQAEEETM